VNAVSFNILFAVFYCSFHFMFWFDTRKKCFSYCWKFEVIGVFKGDWLMLEQRIWEQNFKCIFATLELILYSLYWRVSLSKHRKDQEYCKEGLRLLTSLAAQFGRREAMDNEDMKEARVLSLHLLRAFWYVIDTLLNLYGFMKELSITSNSHFRRLKFSPGGKSPL
jgi:hypothetical protein